MVPFRLQRLKTGVKNRLHCLHSHTRRVVCQARGRPAAPRAASWPLTADRWPP